MRRIFLRITLLSFKGQSDSIFTEGVHSLANLPLREKQPAQKRKKDLRGQIHGKSFFSNCVGPIVFFSKVC